MLIRPTSWEPPRRAGWPYGSWNRDRRSWLPSPAHPAGPRWLNDPNGLALIDGRVLMWGWAREIDRSDEDLLRVGWAGALTFPREVMLRQDQVTPAPVPELDRLRGTELSADGPVTERSFEIRSDAGVRLELINGR